MEYPHEKFIINNAIDLADVPEGLKNLIEEFDTNFGHLDLSDDDEAMSLSKTIKTQLATWAQNPALAEDAPDSEIKDSILESILNSGANIVSKRKLIDLGYPNANQITRSDAGSKFKIARFSQVDKRYKITQKK